MTDDCCSICLSGLQAYHRKLHTTECGHVFHETCFEKIRGELKCPCCRAVVKPLLKQQIQLMDQSIKEMGEYIRMFPAMYQSYMAYQNAKVEELEEKLREAKQIKRLVSAELCDANKHNKGVLEQYKITKRSMVDQHREELAEHQRKKTAIRVEAKAKKQAKKGALPPPPPPPPQKPKDEVIDESRLPETAVVEI